MEQATTTKKTNKKQTKKEEKKDNKTNKNTKNKTTINTTLNKTKQLSNFQQVFSHPSSSGFQVEVEQPTHLHTSYLIVGFQGNQTVVCRTFSVKFTFASP